MIMKRDLYKNQMLNVTLHQNYGLTRDAKNDQTLHEIVFKTGKYFEANDNGLFFDVERENVIVKILMPDLSIKHSEISNIKGKLN